MSSLLLAAVIILGAFSGLIVIRRERTIGFGALLYGCTLLVALSIAVSIPLFIVSDLDVFGFIHLFYLVGVVGVPITSGILFLTGTARGTTRTSQLVIGSAALLPALLGVYGTHIEPTRLRVDRQTLPIEGISSTIRIGVLADLQTTGVGDYEKSVVKTLLDQKPDVVVIPGDFYQMSSEQYEQRWPDFAALMKSISDEVPHVFVVEGNVDSVEGLRPITGSQGGGTLLDDSTKSVSINGETIFFGGVGVPPQYGNFAPTVFAQFSAAPLDAVRILVSHYPDAVFGLNDVDLVISGHTHGGQIAVPGYGPLVTLTDVPREAAAGGLHVVDGTNLYVSSGVGMERGQAPQVRLFVRPSVGVIDLTPSQ